MILFDYGQTLVNETPYDGIAGTRAVLQYATKNKHSSTPEEVQAVADTLFSYLNRDDPNKYHLFQIEIPNYMFNAFLYQSLGIELSLSPQEIDRIFWNAAHTCTPTDGIVDFLVFLDKQNIRTGVISNISYCGEVVEEHITQLLPQHNFEFILASSEYLFRKPDRKIFELALEKADLYPEDVWYVGDNYECDVLGAKNAGLFPIFYVGATHNAPHYNDVFTISSWEQLKQQIDK